MKYAWDPGIIEPFIIPEPPVLLTHSIVKLSGLFVKTCIDGIDDPLIISWIGDGTVCHLAGNSVWFLYNISSPENVPDGVGTVIFIIFPGAPLKLMLNVKLYVKNSSLVGNSQKFLFLNFNGAYTFLGKYIPLNTPFVKLG